MHSSQCKFRTQPSSQEGTWYEGRRVGKCAAHGLLLPGRKMGDGGLITSIYRYNSNRQKNSKLHTRKVGGGGRRWAVILVIFILAFSKRNSPLSKQGVHWTESKANKARKNQMHPAVQVW